MSVLLLILLLFLSITLHEYAHGWVANVLGDPTPKTSGRLTLNPIAHIDPFGTIILPILLLVVSRGAFAFGYAKPVPINPYHFKNPKKDVLWVGLAGPAANFLLALLFVSILKVSNYAFIPEILREVIVINIILAVFNLVPIPPLDGSRVVSALLPYKFSLIYRKIDTVGTFIIMLLIMVGFFRWFILPIVIFILSLLKIKIVM
ncbi:MAG: site-2 protease family protein [Candidatus Omnitrophota bacterium]|jgi:Zn-dependent protease